jgi:hypothetical protein
MHVLINFDALATSKGVCGMLKTGMKLCLDNKHHLLSVQQRRSYAISHTVSNSIVSNTVSKKFPQSTVFGPKISTGVVYHFCTILALISYHSRPRKAHMLIPCVTFPTNQTNK